MGTTSQPLHIKHQILPKPHFFGLSEKRAFDIVQEQLKPLLQSGREDELSEALDELGDNVQLVSGELLKIVFKACVGTSLAKAMINLDLLRNILRRDLEQEEVLHFLWRCLTDIQCPLDLIRVLCEEQSKLLHLYIDLRHRSLMDNEAFGFPLLCIASKLLPSEEDECISRMRVLIEHGANVNARHRDETTPVHVAAASGALNTVEFLIKFGANIDLNIKGETARQIIARNKIELVRNVPVQNAIPQKSQLDLMYEELYAGNQTAVLDMLQMGTIDVNIHNGRETLLQLAVKQKLPEVVNALFVNDAADVNLISGLSTPPIILAINNYNYECLAEIRNRRNLNLCFSYESGTVLNQMALRCTNCPRAADHSHVFRNLIEEAIKQNVHISAKNSAGITALEQLGYNCDKNPRIFHLLLEHGGFLTLDKNLVLNTPPDVFTSFFDSNITCSEEYSRKGATVPWANREEFITANFKFLEPLDSGNMTSQAAEMLPFLEISKSREHQTVLLHDIVMLFLVYKWRKIAFIYIANFFLYALFTATFSAYVYQFTTVSVRNETRHNVTDSQQTMEDDTYRLILVHAFTLLFWLLLLCRELFQMYVSLKHYVRNWENMLEILLLLFSFLALLSELQNESIILGTAIILTYIELTLLIGRHPYTGTYITMFMRVSMKSIELILIFSSFIFAFAYGFFVIFYKFASPNDGKFRDLWQSVLSTIGMAGGEFNLDSLKFNSTSSELIFLVFLIFVPIVLMNLLNALAVSDTQRVIDEASLLCCVANIKHYTKIESMWLGYDPESNLTGERCYGFIRAQKSYVLNKILCFFRTINILPFPQNKYTNPEPTHFLTIQIEPLTYYPQPYWWYGPPTLPNQTYTKILKPTNLIQLLKYLYFRVLLRGNEDEAVNSLRRKKKNRNQQSVDLNDCIDELERNIRVAMEVRMDNLQTSLDKNIKESSMTNKSMNIVVKDELRTQYLEHTSKLERMSKTISSHDEALATIRRQQISLSTEITELKSSLHQIVINLNLIQNSLQVIQSSPRLNFSP